MEKEKAKEILDDISQSVKTIRKHDEYICSTIIKEIHLYKCLREIAKAMDLQLSEKSWECEGAKATEISVIYEGVRFFELENYRKCDKDDGTDRKQNGS